MSGNHHLLVNKERTELMLEMWNQRISSISRTKTPLNTAPQKNNIIVKSKRCQTKQIIIKIWEVKILTY